MADPDEPLVYRGRYALQQPIGKGGMAEVFLAQDQLLDRPVAIKRLSGEHAGDPSFVERFRREAQAAAKLSHPNIVGVFDYFEEGGEYFIVQEYIDGRSLAEILRAEGRLHPDRAADIAADIAAGLGAAHREGMVHRDVKAGNVLVAKDGQVKVADFGIARVFAGGDSELTQAGTVMGTATYFSPEQAQGKPVDPRSDLYSLGVVLYEMLAGEPPFTAGEPVAIAYAHVHEAPKRLREVDPELPAEIDAIAMKLLAKDPARRYPSADDLRADLRRFRQGAKLTPAPVAAPVVVPAAPPPREIDYGSFEDRRYVEPPRRTGFFLLLTLLVFAAVGLGLYFVAQQLDESNDTQRITVPDVEGLARNRAVRDLRELNFRVAIQEEASSEIAPNVVIRQDPQGGVKRREGSTVTIVVSVGEQAVVVPDVIGQDFITANQELTAAGFQVSSEQVDDPSGQFTEGQVWRQSPAAGSEVPAGSVVIISIVPAETTTTSPATLPPATSPPPTLPPATTAP